MESSEKPEAKPSRNPLRRLLIEWFWPLIVRIQYTYIGSCDRDSELTFLNYGYAPLDPDARSPRLTPEEEPNRYSIQLYRHVVSKVDLRDLDVLEVGCGRGGGAAHLLQACGARSVMGIDLCGNSIKFCNQHYGLDGLVFQQGHAEKLKFKDATFDAVVNIESSHCYRRIHRFFDEVRRVLRAGGHFLFTDFRTAEEMPVLCRQLEESGLELLHDEDITANVITALDCDAERRRALIDKLMPGGVSESAKIFAGLPGTSVYESLKDGRMLYASFVLRKA